MEENYIHIFCAFVADLLDRNIFTTEDMDYTIQEFTKVAADIHSREDLLKFLEGFPDYPEFEPLASQLKDSYHAFIF